MEDFPLSIMEGAPANLVIFCLLFRTLWYIFFKFHNVLPNTIPLWG